MADQVAQGNLPVAMPNELDPPVLFPEPPMPPMSEVPPLPPDAFLLMPTTSHLIFNVPTPMQFMEPLHPPGIIGPPDGIRQGDPPYQPGGAPHIDLAGGASIAIHDFNTAGLSIPKPDAMLGCSLEPSYGGLLGSGSVALPSLQSIHPQS